MPLGQGMNMNRVHTCDGLDRGERLNLMEIGNCCLFERKLSA